MTQMNLSKKQYKSISYFISRALFLGIGFSYIYHTSKMDSWISIILGYFIGIIFIYIMNLISSNINFNLKEYLKKKKIIGIIYKIFFTLLYIFLIILCLLIFSNFIKSYYLFNTPTFIIILVIMILGFYLGIKDITINGRLSEILFPISLGLILFILVFLTKYIEISNLLPILTINNMSLLESSLVFATFSTLPHILLIDNKTPFKEKVKGYSITCLILFITSFYITTILGNYFIEIYSFPEYMTLKKIKILDFIENVEKIISLLWYFDIFILLSLSINRLNNFYKKKKNYIIIIALLIILILCNYIFSKDFYYMMGVFNIAFYILLGFLIILVPIFYLITKKKHK